MRSRLLLLEVLVAAQGDDQPLHVFEDVDAAVVQAFLFDCRWRVKEGVSRGKALASLDEHVCDLVRALDRLTVPIQEERRDASEHKDAAECPMIRVHMADRQEHIALITTSVDFI